MIRFASLVLILLLVILTGVYSSQAECKTVLLDELESGVYELNLGDVRMKIEVYNKIVKMKLVGAVNEDWTSVNVEQGTGMISGFVGNGAGAQLKAQSVSEMRNDSFSVSLFKKNSLDGDEGAGYFVSNKGIKCINTTYSKWESLRLKYLPSIVVQSAINLEPDGFL